MIYCGMCHQIIIPTRLPSIDDDLVALGTYIHPIIAPLCTRNSRGMALNPSSSVYMRDVNLITVAPADVFATIDARPSASSAGYNIRHVSFIGFLGIKDSQCVFVDHMIAFKMAGEILRDIGAFRQLDYAIAEPDPAYQSRDTDLHWFD